MSNSEFRPRTVRTTTRKYRYQRVGQSTYAVHYPEGHVGEFAGQVWRTRTGWSGRTANGDLVIEDYPGSRDVAAGNVVQAYRSEKAVEEAARKAAAALKAYEAENPAPSPTYTPTPGPDPLVETVDGQVWATQSDPFGVNEQDHTLALTPDQADALADKLRAAAALIRAQGA